jgi:hypothetical protein
MIFLIAFISPTESKSFFILQKYFELQSKDLNQYAPNLFYQITILGEKIRVRNPETLIPPSRRLTGLLSARNDDLGKPP